MSIASNKRRVFGIKIPDIFLRNDDDDATTGQVTISKAGTTALALTGSGADITLSGTQSQVILSGGHSTLSMSGAAPIISGAIQVNSSRAGTTAALFSGSGADITLSGTLSQIKMTGGHSTLSMSGASPVISGAVQVNSSRAGTTAALFSGSGADITMSGTQSQIVMSGGHSTINMSGASPIVTGAVQLDTSRAGTVAINISGSDADIQLTGTNSQIIMSGNASGISLTGTGAKFYIANDAGQVGTFAFEGSSVRMYFGGGTGTFV